MKSAKPIHSGVHVARVRTLGFDHYSLDCGTEGCVTGELVQARDVLGRFSVALWILSGHMAFEIVCKNLTPSTARKGKTADCKRTHTLSTAVVTSVAGAMSQWVLIEQSGLGLGFCAQRCMQGDYSLRQADVWVPLRDEHSATDNPL